MLANKSKLIDILCYLIIFVLLLIIILPPLLRFLLPQGNDFNNTAYIQSLRCVSKDSVEGGYQKIINTNFNNNVITKVSVTYENYVSEIFPEEKQLIDIEGVTEDIAENRVVYTIEYNDKTKDNLNLIKYFGTIDELKAKYELNEYTCTIASNK